MACGVINRTMRSCKNLPGRQTHCLSFGKASWALCYAPFFCQKVASTRLRFPGSGWDRMAFSLTFLLLVSSAAETSRGQCLAALRSCLSFHLCLCISNLLSAMDKMLILATLCNYSEVTGVNAREQYSSNQNLALCCPYIFGCFGFVWFFPLPVNLISVALTAMLLLE